MNKNIPELRFPEFSGEWESKKMGEIAEITTGNKDTQNKVENGNYPFFVRSQTIERINSYSYDGEAILTSGDGVGVGKNYHYINGKFDFHQRVYCLYRYKNHVYGRYLFFYFSEKFNRRIMRMSAKNSVDSIRRDMIYDMLVLLPSLPEQQKIATFLSAIDDKLQALKKKKALLEQYKKGVMQAIFSQKLRFKDDSGEDFPEWEMKKLREVAKIMYGKDQKQISDVNGRYPILGTGGLMGKTNHFLYDKPSVLIGRKGTIDKPYFMDTPFWTVDTLFYTEILDIASPKWLYYKFQTINWYLYNEASGVPSLSASTINKIVIILPSLPEQTKIANFLTSIDEKLTQCQAQIEQTDRYKKGLLQKMFC